MSYYNKCFEVSPSFLKGQIKTFNPFERIFKNFLFNEIISDEAVEYSKENYDEMVENYYIYKSQFKKYGMTFNVNEEYEYEKKIRYFSKIFFLPENYSTYNENKILYKGKDYYLIDTYEIDKTYHEKDNKVYFELGNFLSKKFELQIITSKDQYQQNIKPGESDLLYIDTKKIGKRSKSLYNELSKREIINYKRIMEIPFLFVYKKFAEKYPPTESDTIDFDSFNDYWNKLVENAFPYSTDKQDFITMLNIMYEDQYLSNFKEKNNEPDKGYLDVEDVENYEKNQEEKKKEFCFFDLFKIRKSLKENLMYEEYYFIETQKVIYELCEREKDSYRSYIVYDPVNNFCSSFYLFEDILDNYIYGLKKEKK